MGGSSGSFHLSDDEQGVIQLWQDHKLLIDTRGVTLPLPRIIYSSLEIGISSHSYGDKEAVLWVDDIEVSDQPLEQSSESTIVRGSVSRFERH